MNPPPMIATVDVVIPVLNEAASLERSIWTLRRRLDAEPGVVAQIVIVDNASSDDTPAIARRLSEEFDGVTWMRLERRGRGRALRAAWTRSTADIVAYMDVDLSTDLDAFGPLVVLVRDESADVAVGSRLMAESRVRRGPKREVISRTYNAILHLALDVHFRDAQCGFKALRRTAARRLLPTVADQEWFFDTELLVSAEREGMRVIELPVVWNDDPDSRVKIVRTALDDLRGIRRLRRELGAARAVSAAEVTR